MEDMEDLEEAKPGEATTQHAQKLHESKTDIRQEVDASKSALNFGNVKPIAICRDAFVPSPKPTEPLVGTKDLKERQRDVAALPAAKERGNHRKRRNATWMTGQEVHLEVAHRTLMLIEDNNAKKVLQEMLKQIEANTAVLNSIAAMLTAQKATQEKQHNHRDEEKEGVTMPRRMPSRIATLATQRSAANQGNDKATSRPPTYAQVAKTRMIGGRKDSIEIRHSKEQNVVGQQETEELADQETRDQYTSSLPPQKPPQHHHVTPLRFDRMKSRKEMPAGKWRTMLKTHSINPVTILFPRLHTIELLVHTEEEQKARKLFSRFQRQPEDPDPFARRDGRPEPLSTETVMIMMQQRIQMIQYERSTIGVRYLEKTLMERANKLPQRERETILKELQQVLRKKRLEVEDAVCGI